MGKGLEISEEVLKRFTEFLEAHDGQGVHKEVAVVASPRDRIPEWMKEKKGIWHHSVDHGFGEKSFLVQIQNARRQTLDDVHATLGKGFVIVPCLPMGHYPLTVVMIG